MNVKLDVRDVPVLELGAVNSAEAVGVAHGEHFRGVIAEHLAWAQAEVGALGVSFEVLARGPEVETHAAAMSTHVPAAMRELEAIARAANVTTLELLALEHVVAVRRRFEEARPDASPDPRGSTLFHTFGPDGAVVALAWDAPEVARFGVLVRWREGEIESPPDHEHGVHEAANREVVVFGPVGTLGLAAMVTTRRGGGRVIGASELHAGEQPAGLGLGGTLRRLVDAEDLASADAWLRVTPRMNAAYWGIADRDGYVGIESVAALAVRTHTGVQSSHVHTNHFFDPVLRRHEKNPLPGASHRRMEAATTAFAQDRPRRYEAVREWLRRHDRRVRAVSAAAADLDVDRPPFATMLVMSPGLGNAHDPSEDDAGARGGTEAGADTRIVEPRLHLQRGLLR
jgi:hypothetical protein